MKRLRSLVLGLFALCSMVGMAQEAEADDTGYIVKVGQVASDFTVTLTDGRTVTLSDFRGRVVMLQFTASWCGVCRKEMPFIEKDIWQKHKSDPDFMLMGIDRDEPLNKVIAFGMPTSSIKAISVLPSMEIRLESYRTMSLLSFSVPAKEKASEEMPSIRQPSPPRTKV